MDITEDSRYTYDKEWSGKAEAGHVVRFCGVRIGEAKNLERAHEIAEAFNTGRMPKGER